MWCHTSSLNLHLVAYGHMFYIHLSGRRKKGPFWICLRLLKCGIVNVSLYFLDLGSVAVYRPSQCGECVDYQGQHEWQFVAVCAERRCSRAKRYLCGMPTFQGIFNTHDMCAACKGRQPWFRGHNCSMYAGWDDCVWNVYEHKHVQKQNAGMLWGMFVVCIFRRFGCCAPWVEWFSRIWGIPTLGSKMWQSRNSRETRNLLWKFLIHPCSLKCLGKANPTLCWGKSPSQAHPAFGMTVGIGVGTREIGTSMTGIRSSNGQGYRQRSSAEDSSSWNRWSAESGRWPHVPAGPDPTRMKATAFRVQQVPILHGMGLSQTRVRPTADHAKNSAGCPPTGTTLSESATSSRAVSFERSGYSGQSSRPRCFIEPYYCGQAWQPLESNGSFWWLSWATDHSEYGYHDYCEWQSRCIWVCTELDGFGLGGGPLVGTGRMAELVTPPTQVGGPAVCSVPPKGADMVAMTMPTPSVPTDQAGMTQLSHVGQGTISKMLRSS